MSFTEPIDLNLAQLNWKLLSPWAKTVQVIKYWFGYWLYTGLSGNAKQSSDVERHLEYINHEKAKYNNSGKSYIHNQFGDLNAYASVCLDNIQHNIKPFVPYKDLVGSWLIWVVLLLVIIQLLTKRR